MLPQRSGGVGVDGTPVSSVKVSWEISGGGCQTQPSVQAGHARESGGVAGEVGVLRSSEEASVMGVERRRDTCSGVRREGGRWLRQEIRRRDEIIINPDFGLRPKDANPTGLGKPNMGKPSVRFDEGRSDSAGLTTAVGSKPPPATSPTLRTIQESIRLLFAVAMANLRRRGKSHNENAWPKRVYRDDDVAVRRGDYRMPIASEVRFGGGPSAP